jgi:hypothetical protein
MLEPLHVLALDPGERVGWARAAIYPDGQWFEMTHGITPLKDMALAVHRKITDYDVVVYETWRLAADKARSFAGSDFPSVQFIGAVKAAAWLNPHVKARVTGTGHQDDRREDSTARTAQAVGAYAQVTRRRA